MKKLFFSLGILSLAIGAIYAGADEPVVMTVDGRPVYKSEFEYLYNKNAGQQLEHQSLDQYVDMFVNYKLKVADALANHLDTTKAFRDELYQYRVELSAPYMRDVEAEKQILDDMYDHYLNQVKVSHIMLALPQSGIDKEVVARADSIRNEILAGRLSWDEAASKYSIDRGSADRGGQMGWIVADRLPASFVDKSYATPTGEISDPVNSGFGVHLIRVEDRRKNPGEVRARHILKLTARIPEEEAALAKSRIDSIYTVLKNGADFADVASRESQDPGTARRGGDLDWFGAGMMVQPFDSLSFALPENFISEPFQTSFGWHILEVTGHRAPKSREEMASQLQNSFLQSEKGTVPEQKFLEKAKIEYNTKLNKENLDLIENMIKENPAGYDSVMVARLSVMDLPVASAGDVQIPLSDVMKKVPVTASTGAANARGLIASTASRAMDLKTLELVRDKLSDSNPDYRNLVNEYSDGILLFDISQQRVWQKAANDHEGVEKFFKKNRKKYAFDEPRFKGYVVFTNSDSLETAVKEYLSTLKTVDPKTLNKDLREKFGKDVRAERVIAKKGENPISDYLGFGGPRPDSSKMSWHNVFAFRGKIINNPEEADDVRGQVTTDYQNALEAEWIKELRKKYPVTINKEVLDTVSEIK